MLNAQWLSLNARDRCVSTDIELQRGVVRSKAPQTAAAMWQLIKLIAKKINMLIWEAEQPTGIEKQKAKPKLKISWQQWQITNYGIDMGIIIIIIIIIMHIQGPVGELPRIYSGATVFIWILVFCLFFLIFFCWYLLRVYILGSALFNRSAALN